MSELGTWLTTPTLHRSVTPGLFWGPSGSPRGHKRKSSSRGTGLNALPRDGMALILSSWSSHCVTRIRYEDVPLRCVLGCTTFPMPLRLRFFETDDHFHVQSVDSSLTKHEVLRTEHTDSASIDSRRNCSLQCKRAALTCPGGFPPELAPFRSPFFFLPVKPVSRCGRHDRSCR